MTDETAPARLCVYCRRHPVEAAYRPFCSKRCKLLDLTHWVDGDYRIAGEPATDDVAIEDADPEAESPSRPAEPPGPSKARTR